LKAECLLGLFVNTFRKLFDIVFEKIFEIPLERFDVPPQWRMMPATASSKVSA
jgi:hypothetical protein